MYIKEIIGKLDPNLPTVHVWGAGIAGLTLAFCLSEEGWNVELYEKSGRVGGKISSRIDEFGLSESAANAIYADEEIINFLKKLSLKIIPAPKKIKRWLWLDGKLTTPIKVILPHFMRIIINLFKEIPPVDDKTNLKDFFSPLMGEKLVDQMLSPALQGIYGTQAENLNVFALWPDLTFNKKISYFTFFRRSRSSAISISFKNGMQEFIDSLVNNFKGKVILNHHGPFKLQKNTIICTDAAEASLLVKSFWPAGAESLNSIEYLKISSTTIKCEPKISIPKPSFGILFPLKSQFNSLGMLINHDIFPHRTTSDNIGSYTFIGSYEDFAEKLAQSDLKKLSPESQIKSLKTYSWARGLPVYNHKLHQARQQLHSIPPELCLFGNYVAGISLRDMIKAAIRFSQKNTRKTVSR